MSNREFFRPRSSLVMAGTVYLVLAVMLIQSLLASTLHEFLLTLAWCIFVGSITYLVIHRPSIEIFDEGIKLTNPLITRQWGWNEVDEIETKYAMAIHSNGRVTYSFAAPAPSRYHSRSLHEGELRGMKIAESGSIRPGDSPRSHSGVAAYLARTRLMQFRASNSLIGLKSVTELNKGGISVMAVSGFVALLLSLYHF